MVLHQLSSPSNQGFYPWKMNIWSSETWSYEKHEALKKFIIWAGVNPTPLHFSCVHHFPLHCR
jgi:hypothetical protein